MSRDQKRGPSRSLAARCFPLRRRLSNVSGPARAACHRVPTGTGLEILGGCGRHGHGATTSLPTLPCPSSIFLQSTASLSANRLQRVSTSPTPIRRPEHGGAATAMSRGCHSAARRGPSRVGLTFLRRPVSDLMLDIRNNPFQRHQFPIPATRKFLYFKISESFSSSSSLSLSIRSVSYSTMASMLHLLLYGDIPYIYRMQYFSDRLLPTHQTVSLKANVQKCKSNECLITLHDTIETFFSRYRRVARIHVYAKEIGRLFETTRKKRKGARSTRLKRKSPPMSGVLRVFASWYAEIQADGAEQ